MNLSNKNIGINFRRQSKQIQFADFNTITDATPDDVIEEFESRKMITYDNDKSNSAKSITQRTFSSMDKHINIKRQLWNQSKTQLSKLQRISNMAAKQIIGFDPLKADYQPFPIKNSYRQKVVIEETSEYDHESSPKQNRRTDKKNTIMYKSHDRIMDTFNSSSVSNNIV